MRYTRAHAPLPEVQPCTKHIAAMHKQVLHPIHNLFIMSPSHHQPPKDPYANHLQTYP